MTERGRALTRVRTARYRAKNRELCRARARQWAKANPDRMKELRRRWYDENYEHVWRYNVERKAKRLGVFVETVDRWVVFDRDRGICGVCGNEVEADFDIDHVVPLTRGGRHEYANVQLAHRGCNASKGNRTS